MKPDKLTQKEKTFNALVRSYLLDGEDFPDKLRNFQFKIKVYRYTPDNRAVLITGRVFDNLEQLPFDLGSKFGTARFKVYISIFDEVEGGRVAFVKLEDFPIEWNADTPPAGDGDEPQDANAEPMEPQEQYDLELAKLKMIQEHEIRMKQMDQQQAMVVAALQAKGGGGGGMKIQELLQVLQMGIGIGSGAPIPAAAEAGGDGGDYLESLLNSPLVAALAARLMPASLMPAASPSGPPAASPADRTLPAADPG